MARPKADQPTPAELEVLKVLWPSARPLAVREVMGLLAERDGSHRAYTSVMSLLNVMVEKGLLVREPRGRAFAYRPAVAKEQTLRSFLTQVLERVYDGSTSLLMAHLLDRSKPSEGELDEIAALLDEYRAQAGQDKARDEGGVPLRNPRSRRS